LSSAGPLIFISSIAVLFGAYEQDRAHFLFSIPEIAFEASITIYTIVKGFKPSPILDDTRYGRVAEVYLNPPGAAPYPMKSAVLHLDDQRSCHSAATRPLSSRETGSAGVSSRQLPVETFWKRQTAADRSSYRRPLAAERPERQAAVDRSSCSRLTSRRSPVRAGHRPSSRPASRRDAAPDDCFFSRKAALN
jgi:hypothetical protein